LANHQAGWQEMINSLGQPLDLAMLLRFNEVCTKGIKVGKRPIDSGLRDHEGRLPINVRTFTDAGYAALMERLETPLFQGWVTCTGDREDLVLHFAQDDDTLGEQKATEALETIRRLVADAGPSPLDKITAIAESCSILEHMHLLKDGNMRTIIFVLNKHLMEAGLSPCIVNDLNCIDGWAPHEIAQEILAGQARFQALLRPDAQRIPLQ
jgi:hypothetical protein